jgi:hypothetical protein
MKKKYPQFLPQTLCHTCSGCSKCELPSFSGVTKCDTYIASYPEYYRSLNKEYGSEAEAKKKK